MDIVGPSARVSPRLQCDLTVRRSGEAKARKPGGSGREGSPTCDELIARITLVCALRKLEDIPNTTRDPRLKAPPINSGAMERGDIVS
jgi:hypothetical protein